jgi:hypothetical protein
MTTPSIEAWVSLAIQIPIVGIFVWFSLQLISSFLKAIDQRDKSWQEFLNQQRDADRASIANMAARFADEIRTLGKEVAELRGTKQ